MRHTHCHRVHNICISSDSFADGGGEMTNRRHSTTVCAGWKKKKKSNLQFAPEVRPSGQVRTSISKISFRAPAIHLPTPPSACWTASLVTKLFWSRNREDTWQIFRSSKCAAVKGRPQRDGVRWSKLVSLHETGFALFLVKILISPKVVWSKPC